MLKNTTRVMLASVVVGSVLAMPAMANASDTTVSFTVASSGALAVSQGTSTATLTDGGSALDFNASLAGTVTGSLPTTTVTDTRGTLAATWSVTVEATGAFVNQSDSAITIAATAGRAYIDAVDVPAVVTLLSSASGTVPTGAELSGGTSDLATPYTLLSGATALGNGSVSFTPAIVVTVPAATPAGTYQATIRQTVG